MIACAPASPILFKDRLSSVSVWDKYKRWLIEVKKLNIYLTWLFSSACPIACAPTPRISLREMLSVVSVCNKYKRWLMGSEKIKYLSHLISF